MLKVLVYGVHAGDHDLRRIAKALRETGLLGWQGRVVLTFVR